MGRENQTTTQNSQQQYTPTAQEQEANNLLLERIRASQGGQIQAQNNGLNLINQLLTGQALPGYLNKLPGGISESSIADISQKSINDLQPGFQNSGLLDSGANAELSARTASNVRRGAEEYNLGNLFNLLNLAVGGQAQIQAPLQNQSGQLSNSLAGLRNVNSSGSGSMTMMNPFLKSFQQSAGQGIGNFFNPNTYIKPV